MFIARISNCKLPNSLLSWWSISIDCSHACNGCIDTSSDKIDELSVQTTHSQEKKIWNAGTGNSRVCEPSGRAGKGAQAWTVRDLSRNAVQNETDIGKLMKNAISKGDFCIRRNSQ